MVSVGLLMFLMVILQKAFCSHRQTAPFASLGTLNTAVYRLSLCWYASTALAQGTPLKEILKEGKL